VRKYHVMKMCLCLTKYHGMQSWGEWIVAPRIPNLDTGWK